MNDQNNNYYRNSNRRSTNKNEYSDPESWDADGLIIEDNTIYEIDLDCYECLMRQRKKLL